MKHAPGFDAAKQPADSAQPYEGYAQWKGWQGDFETSDRDARYFAAELDGIDLSGKRVLEIGFGNGSFLAWARRQNAEVTGTEMIDVLVEQARSKGYDAQSASLQTLLASGRQFDLVVAFDVFEHWHKDELIANLGLLHALLTGDGLLLARFPNGHSPFGRVHQHGDLTHVTTLSSSSVAQLAQMTGFTIERIDNARRVPPRSDFWSALKNRWRRYRRARIEIALGKLYGFGRLPLDPNLSALLRKADKARGVERSNQTE